MKKRIAEIADKVAMVQRVKSKQNEILPNLGEVCSGCFFREDYWTGKGRENTEEIPY